MRRLGPRRRNFTYAVVAALAAFAAAPSAVAQTLERVTIMAPANPGGGWDSTARALQETLTATSIVKSVQVENVGGAGGTRGLVQYVKSKGDPKHWMVSGLVMVGAVISNKTPVTMNEITPIARLTSEWQSIAVTPDAKIQSMQDLVAALKANPGAVTWGGGSAGGTDHITAALIMKAAGADTSKLNYVAHSGGGEAMAAILGNHVSLGVNSISEFMPQVEAGKLKIIGVSSEKRIDGVNAPTFKEAGVDVVIGNWRAVFAPPGIKDADKAAIIAAVDKLVKSDAWKAKLKERGWEDNYLSGDQFKSFLTVEQARIADILKSVGIGG
jgi:putative tricarboxylic transport membrane protein